MVYTSVMTFERDGLLFPCYSVPELTEIFRKINSTGGIESLLRTHKFRYKYKFQHENFHSYHKYINKK